nr:unnamed protein product [Trichobilharzia regenti]
MGACEVYRPLPSESDDSCVHRANSFSASESDVLHVVVSESELTELPLPTYVCELCGIRVKTKANLRAHQIKTHKIMKNAKDIAFYSKQRYTVSHIYHCPVATCKHNISLGGGFSTYWRLKQHYQHVHMQKSYQCEKCKHFFPTPSYHAYHQKLCGATYSCSVCFRSYSSKKHLLQHCRRSGHPNTSLPNSFTKTKVAASVPPTKCAPVAGSATSCNSVPVTTCAPVLFPIIILPVPVPNTNGLHAGNMDYNIMNYSNMNSFLYTSALSALRTLSAEVYPNTNMQVGSPESLVNPSGTSVVLKPNLKNFCNLYTVAYAKAPSSEASTQTDEAYTSMAVSHQFSHSAQPHELISVNTCTDEDDISSFIGGLFCNASVEANFPQHHTVEGSYEAKPEDNLSAPDEQFPHLDSLNKHQPNMLENSIENSVQTVSYIPLAGCLRSGVDQEIQAKLVPPRENASMQTDLVEKLSVEAATDGHHVDRSTYFSLNRMLETPPPPVSMPQSTVSLGTHLSTACQTLHRLLEEQENLDRQPSIIEALNMETSVASDACTGANLLNYEYDLSSGTDQVLRCKSSSSPSDKMFATTSTMPVLPDNQQFCYLNSIDTTTQHDWSVGVDFTHNQTQTIDEDIELWLNSVETQTNLASFDPSFFSDICVGVDDDFFQS